MSYLVVVLLMVAAFLVVGRPLISSARHTRHEPGGVSPWNDLVSRRDAAYRAIKELDFEYQLGNLSESDYRGLRERYRREAAAILREMDVAAEGESAADAAPSGPATPATVPPPLAARADPPCPSCGEPTKAGDRCCLSCGASLEARA